MKLLVTGDRRWSDYRLIEHWLTLLKPRLVIHGRAYGADRLAGQAAEALEIETISQAANWTRYGKAAGPLRNQQMIDKHKPTHVIAFHHDLTQSRGTRDMVKRSLTAKLKPLQVRGKGKGVRLVVGWDTIGNEFIYSPLQDLARWVKLGRA